MERSGQRVEGVPGRQGRLLLAYLVLNRQRMVPRDELVQAVWPRDLPAASDSGLNALVSKLRRALGPGTLEGRSGIRLRLEATALVDVEVALASVHRAESAVVLGEFPRAWAPSLAALFISQREFLSGEDAPWIDEQRSVMTNVRIRALAANEADALGMGGTELPAAVRAGRQLVRLAPFRENGYRLLMQALANEGNAAEALNVYGDLRLLLRDELGASPCAATQAVHEQLLRA